MKKRLLAGILITLLLFVVARRISKNRPQEIEEEFGGTLITHSTVYEQVGPGQPEILLKADRPLEIGAEVIYRVPGSQAADTVAMTEISSGVWSARLPQREKGERIEYGFLLTSREESDAGITTASSRTGYHLIKYKGEVSITVLILHILCMFAAFYFIVEASIGALAVLFRGEDREFTVAQTRWVLLFTFLGGWPLGFTLNWQRFGPLWEGFPFGYDITDNKTQLIAIFWLIVAAMAWKSFANRRTGRDRASPVVYATAVIIASVLSMILYLVPHSL